jgi:hypothetical protein
LRARSAFSFEILLVCSVSFKVVSSASRAAVLSLAQAAPAAFALGGADGI